MSWLTDEEKLLCHMVLDDSLGPRVSAIAEGAFFRAFIVQNRKTGEITAKMRWSYKEPIGKSWVEIKPTDQTDPPKMAVERLRCGIENVLKIALTAFGVGPKKVENAIHSFYPPDDGGDPQKTILWLEERDLIEVTEVEIEPEKPDGEIHE